MQDLCIFEISPADVSGVLPPSARSIFGEEVWRVLYPSSNPHVLFFISNERIVAASESFK